MKALVFSCIRSLILLASPIGCLPMWGGLVPDMPTPIVAADTANSRWLQKPVLAARLLDDMEQTNAWSHQGCGTMSFTRERAKDGSQSIRMVSPTLSGAPNQVVGRPFGECVAPELRWRGLA